MPARTGKTRHEASQFDEVAQAQERAPLADHDLGIRSDYVRPLRWYGANGRLIYLQQQPLAVPIEAFADASELLPAERVERVGDADKVRRSGGNGCIPN